MSEIKGLQESADVEIRGAAGKVVVLVLKNESEGTVYEFPMSSEGAYKLGARLVAKAAQAEPEQCNCDLEEASLPDLALIWNHLNNTLVL